MIDRFDGGAPLYTLTIGEFVQLLDECYSGAMTRNSATGSRSTAKGRLTYGLRGIQELFNCSHKTAQRLKNTVIRDAVMQNGRKIVVDVDRALELFNERKKK
jgi:hypothetical protein